MIVLHTGRWDVPKNCVEQGLQAGSQGKIVLVGRCPDLRPCILTSGCMQLLFKYHRG